MFIEIGVLMAIPFVVGIGARLGTGAVRAAVPKKQPQGFSIRVDPDVKAAMRQLRKVGERNIPLAVAQSLTATAKHLQKVQARSLPKHLDAPTPFTKKAYKIKWADVRDFKTGKMKASVFAKPIQASYLSYSVYGGVQRPKGKALTVPGPDAKLNKYGNFPRNYIKTQRARPDTFSGQLGNVAGIWQRSKSGRKLLVVYKSQAEKKPILPFHQISARVVPREVRKQLNRSIARAARAGR